MSVKEFFKEWKPKTIKEMDKDDRTYLLYEFIPTIVEFHFKKSHNQKFQADVKELFDRMENRKFAKTLLRILKTPDASPVDFGMASVIAKFIEQRREFLEENEELVELYKEAIEKILKKRVKKIRKEVELEPSLIQELLVVAPEPEVVGDPRFVGIYVSRVLRKLYFISKESETGIESHKTLKKLFKGLFGKEMLNQVAISVLLERKNALQNFNDQQKAMWNMATNFALAILEKNEKKELKELIEHYATRRAKDAEKERDSARRIQFAQISEEDYPKLTKVANKLSKEDEFKPFL